MHFLRPQFLTWAWILIVPVLLYLLRRRPKKVKVSSLLFFQSLSRVFEESPWLRRLKQILSFLLTCLIILSVVGALARPVLSPEEGAFKSVTILIDRSASMGARAEGGVSLLEKGLREIRGRLAGFPEGTVFSVVLYDSRVEVPVARTYEKREVLRALRSISVRPIEGREEEALRIASELASLDPPAALWHLTDQEGSNAFHATSGVSYERLCFASKKPINAGITSFSLRKLPLSRTSYEGFVEVAARFEQGKEAEVKFEIRLDGRLTSLRKLKIGDGGKERLLIPFEAGSGKIIELRVSLSGDMLSLDDRVFAWLPMPNPLKVLWVSKVEDPFTELALSSLVEEGKIEVIRSDPSSYREELGFDLAIFESFLPQVWPKGRPALVIDPPGSLGPVISARIPTHVPIFDLRAPDPLHPLLFGVATERIRVTQSCVLQEVGGLEPVWTGAAGPVLLAGEVKGQRLVIMAFSPLEATNLPLLASFPLLLGNAVYWLSEDGERAERILQTGTIVDLEGKSFRWVSFEDGELREGEAVSTNLVELDRIGLWRTGKESGGACALLSPKETLLPRKTSESEHNAASNRHLSYFLGDLVEPALWFCLLLLLLENYLFHRKGVY